MTTGKNLEEHQKRVRWRTFLKDVFICSLGSYGGPEAHYGVFSSILVEKRKYLTEEELTEMIGLFALVPGPASTQTITAIGYYAGGPILALLTFLVWVLPAIVTMGLIGVFFTQIDSNDSWKPIITYLPAVAVAFIIYAALTLSKKVLKETKDWILFTIMLILSLLLAGYSMWVVPILLVLGGLVILIPHLKEKSENRVTYKPRWLILVVVIGLAVLNEGLRTWITAPWVTLYTSFYRYGYSVIGGGQIVIPLMIQDLVQSQSLISLRDFLSGYAIDQAIPGPLFSFAAFVSSRSFAGTGFSFLAGLIGGFSIFMPGTLLVFFIFPLWRSMRKIIHIKYFLNGVTVTAASLITMTAITQSFELPVDISVYGVVIVSTLLLLSKKVPAPLIVVIAAVLGFLI
ncbi:chromate efflux transporter [Listeria innocua]|uniref:chromate efflux transporter n=1 Tax=Listeria innocua TaxID=1642 RepID=UPI0029EE3192|nr:chromate efflux transporter [Listeria innocua]EKA7725376.1 chromate efflux transporter [Listeria innocua]EKA7728119.1 chromate efflux transporter [Listeria innocua]EKA7728323.1 chromate efflux transporter [Listeria innocua]EKA7734194.1 chromate efflux transporter [Listeria innocua]